MGTIYHNNEYLGSETFQGTRDAFRRALADVWPEWYEQHKENCERDEATPMSLNEFIAWSLDRGLMENRPGETYPEIPEDIGQIVPSEPVAAVLMCEVNTPAMDRRVAAAARKHFHKRDVRTNYEHGQWWISLPDGSQYSVNDAEGPGTTDGFDFELVTQPDET